MPFFTKQENVINFLKPREAKAGRCKFGNTISFTRCSFIGFNEITALF